MSAALLGPLSSVGVAGSSTALATVNGQGSTYAALAFQTWTQKVQIQGLNVNYTATGSPAGLSAYQENTATFAGTEGEYSELYSGTPDANQKVARGFAYTPDVAGAVAIMYHVALNPTGSDPVNYLHLSPLTIARIFMGYITNWDSPTISKDNKGLVLPDKSITLDLRSGQSGTTALFYDFVRHEDPTQYLTWAQNNQFGTNSRIWEVDNGLRFGSGPGFESFGGSDQQAEAISSPGGLWSIGYDEFGYALVYQDSVAWVQNASGNWVQPYAENIAAALKSAVLAPDTSQTLSGVYASTTPTAYPASYYSYILYQCAPTPTRPTCKTPYPDPGVINTMAKFMRYVACTGQVTMATIGYSPLPAALSQFLANAIGYMTGQSPATLTAQNCANPQFQGNLGVGAAPPPDPTKNVQSEGNGPGSGGSLTAGAGGASNSGSTNANATGTKASESSASAATGKVAAVGTTGSGSQAVGGGSGTWLTPSPVAYDGPAVVGVTPPWPLVVLAVLLLGPAAWWSMRRWRRRTSGS